MTKRKRFWQIIIPLFISLASIIAGIYPYLLKPTNLFFNMDPDPMYIGNALQLLQTGKVYFIDHPGTPLLSLISFFFVPVKIYVGYVLHLPNFSLWFLHNLDFIYLYVRVLLSGVFFAGLFVFHYVIYKKYKNILVNIFFGSILFLDQMHLGMYWGITPEILCFALTAYWFYLLNKFEETGKIKNVYWASVIAGVIFATKMSFLFVPLAVFVYLFNKLKGNRSVFKAKLNVLYKSILFTVAGFLIGVIPLWYKLYDLLSYVFSYFIHTDKMGLGSVGLIDFGVFKFTLLGLFNHSILLIVFLVFVIAAAKSFKKDLLIKSILATSLLGFFAFMKYEDFHYQTANILLLSIAASAFFAKIPNVYKMLVLAVLILFLTDSLMQNFKARRQYVLESYNLQSYIDEKNFSGKIVWDYAKSKDYSILRSLRWTNFFFVRDFQIAYPDLMELNYNDLSKIFNYSGGSDYELSKTCWQVIILQKTSWDKFIKIQLKPSNYLKEEIPGTDMLAVTYKNDLNCKTNTIK